MTKAMRREIVQMINDRGLRRASIAVAESGRKWFKKMGMQHAIPATIVPARRTGSGDPQAGRSVRPTRFVLP